MIFGRDDLKKDFDTLISRESLGHAYLFFGPPQVGKFAFAKELAARVERGAWELEGSGAALGEVRQGRPLTDVLEVAPDPGGTIGINAVRALKAFLQETPFISSRRTAIVERAEALTTEAQNALLKIAEEPPSRALLLFTASDPELLMPTLVSRLSSIYMPILSEATLKEWLRKEKGLDAKRAAHIADVCGGKPGLAAEMADGRFEERERLPRAFLETPSASRKDFLKALLEPEDFNFRGFLDDLILVLSRDARQKQGSPVRDGVTRRNSALWHAVIKLRQMADATGLNPRIQLQALGALI